jgi:hypothetical protein
MSINYTYKIINVDEAARVMEIVYEAEGHPTQHIGARLPYEGETLDAIIRMYSPLVYWETQKLSVVTPDVGLTGSIKAADELAAAIATEKAAYDAQVVAGQGIPVQGAQTL